MGDRTGIEYLDATWNPLKGCSRESSGCVNCWAERMAARFYRKGESFYGLTKNGKWTGDVKLYPHELIKPVRWKRPRRIGVCFMGDLFHGNANWIDQAAVFGSMLMSPQHQFLVLTKHPKNYSNFIDLLGRPSFRKLLLSDYPQIDPSLLPAQICVQIARIKTAEHRFDYNKIVDTTFPPKNVWFGTSVENQEVANVRVKDWLEAPAFHKWLSIEPLLGAINIDEAMYGSVESERYASCAFGFVDGFGCEIFVEWVVVGGESGPGYRPMDLAWARSLRDECAGAGVPFFFKQTAGKGIIPKDLFVQQLPDGLVVAGPV